ncbi:sugar kinase [Microbacterium sp. BWT-B31]|uniref:sugar kinase n=1 Tax=Microbacterium sp. BWT-B31 TaxID=3232072 RepID=UPI003529CFA2
MSGLITLGETMGLFRATDLGSLAHQSGFRLAIGGAESNVAIGVSRLGGRATWIGRVGSDGLGERVTRELRAESVDVRAIIDHGARTGMMLKERPVADFTRVSYYRSGSAGSRLQPSDLDAQLIAGADVLHVTGITPALSRSAAATVRLAIEIALSEGVPISFDVNHRASLWGPDEDAARIYREIATQATIVFAGADEASLLVGAGSPDDLALRIAELGASQVLIKMGEDGCVARLDGTPMTVPAVSVRPLDTVGAGDAFVAGYLAEYLAGAPVKVRLDTAVRAGAFACLGPGDWESNPRRADLDLLNSSDPVLR